MTSRQNYSEVALLFGRMLGVVLLDAVLMYLDHFVGPDIPFHLFYLLAVFFGLKYVNESFGYAIAAISAFGAVVVNAWGTGYPVSALSNAWQFASSFLMYSMFCYLLGRQMAGLRHARLALEKITNLHQTVISRTRSGITAFRQDGTCVLANEAAAAIVGASKEELLQQNFRQLPSWRDSGLMAAAERALLTDEIQQFEAYLTTIGGNTLWCGANFSTFMMNGEKYLLMMFLDVTEKVAAQQALLDAKESAEAALARAALAERRITEISEETQRRIGQELHDNLGQLLTGVACLSQSLYQKLSKRGFPEQDIAAMITRHINQGVADTRHLAQGLYPVELQTAGLAAMLERLAESVRTVHGLECEFVQVGDFVVEDDHVAINLFRIVQEAINNVTKHSGATRVQIRAVWPDGAGMLEIVDNGRGVDNWDEVAKKGGLGVHTMKYRADIIGATLLFASSPAGGTRVAISLMP
jgi:two-component system CheB/CheR fusion protein